MRQINLSDGKRGNSATVMEGYDVRDVRSPNLPQTLRGSLLYCRAAIKL